MEKSTAQVIKEIFLNKVLVMRDRWYVCLNSKSFHMGLHLGEKINYMLIIYTKILQLFFPAVFVFHAYIKVS